MIEGMNDDFISTLKRVRLERNLTQQDLARKLGVSRAAIGQWERGQTAPTFANMKALADLFNFSDKLVGENPSRKRDYFVFWRILTANSTFPDEQHSVPVNHFCTGPLAVVRKTASPSIDYLVRTQILEDHDQAYGVAIGTDATSPRFEVGETIYVTPADTPSVGEYGIFLIHDLKGIGDISVLRKLVSETDEALHLQSVRDREVITVQRSLIGSAHRIVPWNELLMLRKQMNES